MLVENDWLSYIQKYEEWQMENKSRKKEENKEKKEMKSTPVIFLSALPNHCATSFCFQGLWQQRCSHLNCYCHIYAMHNSSVAAADFSSSLNMPCLCTDIWFSRMKFVAELPLLCRVCLLALSTKLGSFQSLFIQIFFSSAIFLSPFLLGFQDSQVLRNSVHFFLHSAVQLK